jgi:hypothetical protein
MNWYHVITKDNTVKNPFVADREDLKGFEEEDFQKGKPIKKWDGKAWLKAAKPANDGDPDDSLLNDISLPVYSKRLQENAAVTGVQFLPLRVLRPKGGEITGYAIANILNLVPALDRENAKIDIFPDDWPEVEKRGEIWAVRKAALVGAKLEGFDIIRLPDQLFPIYVSEKVRQVFIRGKFTGVGFSKVLVS